MNNKQPIHVFLEASENKLFLFNDSNDDFYPITEQEYCSVARYFIGWKACSQCDETDGSVACEHRSVGEMLREAEELCWAKCIGIKIQDPGWFAKENKINTTTERESKIRKIHKQIMKEYAPLFKKLRENGD